MNKLAMNCKVKRLVNICTEIWMHLTIIIAIASLLWVKINDSVMSKALLIVLIGVVIYLVFAAVDVILEKKINSRVIDILTKHVRAKMLESHISGTTSVTMIENKKVSQRSYSIDLYTEQNGIIRNELVKNFKSYEQQLTHILSEQVRISYNEKNINNLEAMK